MQEEIASIRTNYSQMSLDEDSIDRDPIAQFQKWWKEAIDAKIDEPNAMTLATASADGLPSARIVLLKGFSREGFLFFSNYKSFKGKQLDENPKACLVFFWKELERQVRITGLVQKASVGASDEYFHSRPTGSQVGATISPQSEVIESRKWLEDRYELAMADKKETFNRPSHWGGYLVKPVVIEFWQGRPSRLHDRLQFDLFESEWKISRLAP